MSLLAILCIFGLAFLVKESDGPFDLISKARFALMQNKYLGVFFYKLLDCYFCVGFHAGWIIYLLLERHYHFNLLICWGLAGGTSSLILDKVIDKLRG